MDKFMIGRYAGDTFVPLDNHEDFKGIKFYSTLLPTGGPCYAVILDKQLSEDQKYFIEQMFRLDRLKYRKDCVGYLVTSKGLSFVSEETVKAYRIPTIQFNDITYYGGRY